MMKRFFLLCLALLSLAAPAHAQMSAPVKIVVLGDNLTSGFQLEENQNFSSILQQYARSVGYDATVVNMSKIAQKVYDGLYRLDEVLAQKPDMVIIQLGYNDALEGADMRALNSNLNTLIYQIKSKNLGVVLLRADPPPTTPRQIVREYDYMFDQLYQMHKVAFYRSLLAGIEGNPKLTLDDGLHPNAKGVGVMVQYIFPTLEPVIRYSIQMRQYQQQ
jgi:acyl-CoA thioesterase-1